MTSSSSSSRRLVVLRGLPGAGKSTFVRENLSSALVCSADAYFMRGGEYRFDPSKLPNAHASCFYKAVSGCLDHTEHPLIVIDNTSLSVWEISPYASLAAAYGYEFEIITLTCDPETSFNRNIHGVPRATIDRMAATLEAERLLPWWKHTII